MSARGPALVGAVLLALAVGGVSWQAHAPQHGAVPVPAVARIPAPTAPRAASTPTPARAEPRMARSIEARLAAWSPPSAGPLRDGETEICGFGRARTEDEIEPLRQRAAAVIESVHDAVKTRMLASDDPHTRAAALMVQRDAVPLVDMALRSSDPTLYAFARQACLGADQPPARDHCRLLSAEQMARLDPHNLVAWLQVAQEAQQRGDAAGLAEAFYRASLAREMRHRAFGFAALALASVPEALPPGEVASAVVGIIGIHAAQALPAYQPLTRWCAKTTLTLDANRRQVCDRIARTMVGRADNLLDLAIGRRVGEFAGWPAEEVELHSARLQGYAAATGERVMGAAGGMLSCESVRSGVRWVERASREGEVAALHDAVKDLGWTDATMLERYRIAQARRAAEAAGSAPR